MPGAPGRGKKRTPHRAIGALVEDAKAEGGRQPFARPDLDHGKCVGGKPAGGGECRKRRWCQPAAVGRVEQGNGADARGARRAGGVAENDMGPALLAQLSDIMP
jgi:hypothetical protein